MGGKDDLLTPPTYSEYLHKEIKGSDLVIVEDAGHMVMIEQPDAVNHAIEDFVI
jgi:pimeloyl-ACP methyl ester carboxylesterase